MSNRKVILYIAMSLDGYIAKSDDDLSFLSIVEQKGQDYGYMTFMDTVDTVIVGRRTYDKVISMGVEHPHQDKEVYVITRTERQAKGKSIFYTGDIKQLVGDLKLKNGKNIFVDGGAEVVHIFLKEKLIDELIISIIPILLGDGIPLFNSGRSESRLQLLKVQHFEKGLVQVHYKIIQ